MPHRKVFLVSLAAAALVAAMVSLGCGAEPVAADGCRKIEEARCEAAPSCTNLRVPDVAECKRFYRDQCLHGLALESDPGAPTIDRCVSKLHECASAGPEAACGGTTTCGAIEAPERLAECAFLIPPPPTTTPASGGGGSSGAAGAGSSGAGGG